MDSLQETFDLRVFEATQRAQLGPQIDVDEHVHPAREVRHHHRRDPGHEQPLEPFTLGRRLDRFHQRFEGTGAMDQIAVDRLVARHHLVGEIVVFVDQQIERVPAPADSAENRQKGDLGVSVALDRRQVVGVVDQEALERRVDVIVERRGDLLG